MAPLMTTTPLTSSAFDYGIRAIGRRTFVDESPFISNEESLSLCVHMQLECIENVKYSQHCNLLLPKFCTELASKRGSPGQNYQKKVFCTTSKYSRANRKQETVMGEALSVPWHPFLAFFPHPLHFILSSFNSFVSSEPWTSVH